MSLTLSSATLARLEAALPTLSSPSDLPTAVAWADVDPIRSHCLGLQQGAYDLIAGGPGSPRWRLALRLQYGVQ
jgi:hypothetical protein